MTSSHTTEAAVVVADRLTVETAQRVLIDEASFALQAGQRVALVGRNGGGKTSLFEVLAAGFAARPLPAHLSVSGAVTRRPGAICGYLPQHPSAGESAGTVRDYLATHSGEAGRLHAVYERLIADTSHPPSRLDELGGVVERLTALQAWDLPTRQELILNGMGVSQTALSRPVSTLSGGEATKLILAGLLLAAADLLLLDEPTNNLDEESAAFLRRWLKDTGAAVLVVSHDRDFLDDVCDSVLAIDEETSQVELYGGDYTFYRQRRDEQFLARVRAFEEQEAKRGALLASARTLGASALRFQDRSQNDFYRARGKKVARRATVQLARIERQLTALGSPQRPRRPRIEVPALRCSGRVLVRAQNVSFGFGPGPSLFEGLSLAIHEGERFALVGPNGAGKTTLLRVLLGEVPPSAGEIERDPGLTVGYLAQSVADPLQSISVVEHARRLATVSEERARELIGQVVFTDVGDAPLAHFSAGERRRIELAVFFAAAPDLVVLDEPTNHLDLPTIEMLEEALGQYRGAVMVATHDRRFLAGLAVDRVLALGSGGVLERPRLTAEGSKARRGGHGGYSFADQLSALACGGVAVLGRRVSLVALGALLLSGCLVGISPQRVAHAAPTSCDGVAKSGGGTGCKLTADLLLPVTVGPVSSPEACNVSYDLYEPVPAPANSSPVILTTNGFGGSKADQAGLGFYFAPQGYVVLSYSGLGFGNSTGCKISLDDPAYDGKAAMQIIDHLATLADVKKDATGPLVGMIGGSYGGAIQYATAAMDPRVRTIIPIITWNDLGYSLGPNNQTPSLVYTDSPPGVLKYQWAELFFASGLTTSTQQPPAIPPPNPPPCGDFLLTVCQAEAESFLLGYPSPNTINLLRHASMVGYGSAGQVHIPTMLVQGEADTLFNLNEAVANYNLIKATGAPVKLVFQSWGHSNASPRPGEFTRSGDPTGLYETNLVQHWFDRYLKGDSAVDTGAKVEYYRDYADSGVGTPASIDAAYGKASSYPIGAPFSLYPSADGTLHTSAATVTAGSPSIVNPPGGQPASYSETSAVQDQKPFSQVPPTDPPGESVSFTTGPLTAPLNEVGIPTLSVTVNAPTNSNANPALQPELFVKIYDVAPDGSVTLPERLVSPVRLPAGQSTVTLTLPGLVHQFGTGHQLRLTISSTDNAYMGSRQPGVITFPLSTAAPDVLTLPVDGAVAGIHDVAPLVTVPPTGASCTSAATPGQPGL